MKVFYTMKEVAKLVGISYATIRRLALFEEIPCHRVGKKIMFTVDDIQVLTGKESFDRLGI